MPGRKKVVPAHRPGTGASKASRRRVAEQTAPAPPASELDLFGFNRRIYASSRAKAVSDELEAEFTNLKQARDAQGRGAAFEKLLARLLHMSDFDVVRSADSAPGRQVDITATSPSLNLLVEAKWQRASVDVSDIAALADRLDQSTPGSIGLCISMSEYTDGARARVLDDKRALARGRVIILLDPTDVEDILTGRTELRPLLERRLELLRVYNQTREPTTTTGRIRLPIALPPADVWPVERRRPALPSAAYNVVFVDAGWFTADASVSYKLEVPLPETRGSIDDLRYLLELAHASLVLTDGGGFTVTQMGPAPLAWHGSGVEPLLRCLSEQGERYADAEIVRPHHSEEFALVVPFEDGWLALTGRHSAIASHRPRLRQLHLELRLPYLPLDMNGIAAFTRRLGFRHIGLSTLSRPLIHADTILPGPSAKPLGYGTGALLGKGYITRSVVTNPWYGNPRACASPDGEEYPWAAQLAQSSFIDATIGDALSSLERVNKFAVTSVDAIQFSRVTAIHAQLHYTTDDIVRGGASRRAEKGHHGKPRS